MDEVMFFAAMLLGALIIIGCTSWLTAYLDGYHRKDYQYRGISRQFYRLGSHIEFKRTMRAMARNETKGR